MVLEREPFRVLLPLLRHVVSLNDENCRLTIPVVKGRCARDAIPHTFNIDLFECGKNNSTKLKLIYNEFGNLIDSVTFLLTSVIGGILYKRRQWLAWGLWWHALAFVTQMIIWRRAYVA